MKRCFKCGAWKPLTEFYRHPRMKDGRLNKCKDCARRDVHQHYQANRTHYSAYEKTRNQSLQRKQKRLEYARRGRHRNPEKNRARQKTKRAIQAGILQRLPCQVCGNPKSQAHHEDYSKPLEVRWMCFRCHREIAHGQTVIAS